MSRTEKRGDVERGYLAWRRSMPGQQSQAESDFGDSSGSLFSTYSGMTEREDNRTTERWQRDALVILIFVSFYLLSTPLQTPTRNYRLVCFPSSSPYWSPCPCRTSDQTCRIPPHSISRTFINFSP